VTGTARPTTSEPPASIRDRLTASAEELFAGRGFDGVSVREITDHANTRLAAVSDQFGGKEELFRAVILRRIRPVNEERRALLSAPPPRGGRARQLEALVDAFCEPMRRRAGDPGWDNYFRLIGQLANSAHPIRSVIAEEFNGIAADIVARLRDIFPDAREPAVQDAYLHLVAATLHTYSNNLRLDSLTEGRHRAHAIADRHEALRAFVTGGITRLLAPPGARSTPSARG
jgi:AcrR family transcriptional regulator